MRRLYVSTMNGATTFWVDSSVANASLRFADARPASGTDMLAWWELEKIESLPVDEACRAYGVSRQTYHAWRRKAGVSMKRRPPASAEKLREAGLRVVAGGDVAEAARSVGLAKDTLIRKLRRLGFSIVTPRAVMPSDDDLVALATGRSWAELAAVVQRSVGHLHRRVYGNKDLAQRVRAVMLRSNSAKRKVVVNAE